MDRDRREIHEVYLVHIAKELATNVLATGLLVVEDARRGGLEAARHEDGFKAQDNEHTRIIIPKPLEGRSKLTQDSI
jgi:hypothetical protein